MTAKHILVIVRTRDPARTREALRAAVGLCLRGDRVAVRGEIDAGDADLARSLAMLQQLGHDVDANAPLGQVLRAADAVEVWT